MGKRRIRIQRLQHFLAIDPENRGWQDGGGSGQTLRMRWNDALLADEATLVLQSERRLFPVGRGDTDFYPAFVDVKNAIGRITLAENNLAFGHIKQRLPRATCRKILVHKVVFHAICECQSSCNYHASLLSARRNKPLFLSDSSRAPVFPGSTQIIRPIQNHFSGFPEAGLGTTQFPRFPCHNRSTTVITVRRGKQCHSASRESA